MKYFNRIIDSYLDEWKNDNNHKPVLLRGARQVGKSSAVRNLAKKFDYFLEINFEEDKVAKDMFENSNLTPQLLCAMILPNIKNVFPQYKFQLLLTA